MKRIMSLLAVVVLSFAACRSVKNPTANNDDGKIEVTFVQVNDVYEIAPLAGGQEGGQARVAALKKEQLRINPNTFLVMAGDFISPSVYNSLSHNGQPIRGAQMIEAMNSAGVDMVCFGNHEFDFSYNDLQNRINESKFLWISSNAFHKTASGIVPFIHSREMNSLPFPQTHILTVKDKDGTTASIGVLGLVLNSNPADYVSYNDAIPSAKQLYSRLKDSVDAVVAITHQGMDDDEKLAKELPHLTAILGGHEHDMRFSKVGNVPITKAHANARSAYIITVKIDKSKRKTDVTTKLKYLDESIPLDSLTNVVVQKWKKIADDSYGAIGFEPMKTVIATGEPLDARMAEVRSKPTNFTHLVTEAMAYACPQADVVIFHSGSVRVDDILILPVTQYDILRTFPFGGGIREVDMKGSLLLIVLEAAEKSKGTGSYLHYRPVVYDEKAKSFMINKAPISPTNIYRVALAEYLLTGKAGGLNMLNPENNPEIIKVYPAETSISSAKSDFRLAIVRFLENRK